MNVKELKESGWVIFEAMVGSHAYGLNRPGSDVDTRGIYIQPFDNILGFGYVEQISDDTNDTTFYEIRRFIELLSSNNPNILEFLGIPEDKIITKHPVYDMILENKEKFITKICKDSFAGYAVQQIKKARGLNKKIVNPVDKERKTPLDFCYVPSEIGGSVPFIEWFGKFVDDDMLDRVHSSPFDIDVEFVKSTKEEIVQQTKYIGLAAIPNARDLYHVFFSRELPYRGVINEDLSSNDIRLTSIPKGEVPVCVMSYNKDGYTKYCKDYKEYWEWVEKRNEVRYNTNMEHGKGYDSKNMMHCHRLLSMSIEIAQGKGIIVYRPDREYLLKIRSGEMDYNDLLASTEEKIKISDQEFEKCNLPDRVDREFTNQLLIRIRKEFYKSQYGGEKWPWWQKEIIDWLNK